MSLAACLGPDAVLAALAGLPYPQPACPLVLRLPAAAELPPPAAYARLLGLTLLLEAPVYAAAWRVWRPGWRAALGPTLASTLLLNLVSHPLVVLGLPPTLAGLGLSVLGQLLVQEGGAVLIEAALLVALWRRPWRGALLASSLANLASWWLGLRVLA